MANAKDIKPDAPTILLIGDSGTGKTRFLRTLPRPYIFDFDGGAQSLAGVDLEYDTYKDMVRGQKPTPELSKRGLYEYGGAWDAAYKKLIEIGKTIGTDKAPLSVAFDSMTFMSMVAVNKILVTTGHDAPHQGTWGAHHEYFKTVFAMVTAWGIPIVATAHIERKENDLTTVVEKLPMLTGKLAGIIGAFFSEVYYIDHKHEGGKSTFTIATTPTPQLRQAKSRWNVPNGSVANYADIQALINKGVASAPAAKVG